MNEITVRVPIQAQPKVAWEAIADFFHVDNFHPFVKQVDGLSKVDRGEGAIRRCNFTDGTSVVETITNWNEGKGFSVDLSEYSVPLAWVKVRFWVEPSATTPGTTVSGITMQYQVKYGPLGWLMNQLMIKPQMTRRLRDILLGLDNFVHSKGEALAVA